VRTAAEAGLATTRALVITSIVFVASVPVRVACARRRRQFALSHTAQTCVRFSAAVVPHSIACRSTENFSVDDEGL
jgi:hypothetical protein